MILLIVNKEYDEKKDRYVELVSHGFDMETEAVVILPHEPPEWLGAVMDHELGEWVLDSDQESVSQPRSIYK